MKTLKILIIAAIPIMVSSCLGFICINGSGVYATEERGETGFNGIANSTSADVYFSSGDSYSIFVEADDNLRRYIKTSVSSGVLEIEIDGTPCISPGRTPVVYVTAPSLETVISSGSGDILVDTLRSAEVKVVNSGSGNIIASWCEAGLCRIITSGSGDITLRNNYSDEISVKITGTGNVTSDGSTGLADIVSSGTGQAYLENLTTLTCEAIISGSGSIYIDVSDEINANLSGSGSLYYTGNPIVYENRTGSGRVVNVNR